MLRLENWSLHITEKRGKSVIVGRGDCYGNPRFTDGTRIHTSHILEIKMGEEERQLKLLTNSGSCYIVDFADINEPAIEECTREALQWKGIPLDIEKVLILKKLKINNIQSKLSRILEPGGLYVRITDGKITEAYFKLEDNSITQVDIIKHIGDFTDSILLMKGPCDWRILLSGYFSADVYSWSEAVNAVSIENIGKDFVLHICEDKGVLCRYGEITIIKREDYICEEN